MTTKQSIRLTELEKAVEEYKDTQPRDANGEKISQNEVARRMGMNESRFSNIITGKVKNPRRDFFIKLSDLTGKPYSELLATVDPRLKQELGKRDQSTVNRNSAGSVELTPKMRFVVEELSKLPDETLDLFLSLARQVKAGADMNKSDKKV